MNTTTLQPYQELKPMDLGFVKAIEVLTKAIAESGPDFPFVERLAESLESVTRSCNTMFPDGLPFVCNLDKSAEPREVIVRVMIVYDNMSDTEAVYIDGSFRFSRKKIDATDVVQRLPNVVTIWDWMTVRFPTSTDWPEDLATLSKYTLRGSR